MTGEEIAAALKEAGYVIITEDELENLTECRGCKRFIYPHHKTEFSFSGIEYHEGCKPTQ